MIGDEHLEHQCPEHEERRHEMTVETCDKLGNFSHGCDGAARYG
jgi:hypothetical protein